MVIIKYTKLGYGAFVGDDEIVACWNRVTNRAEIPFDNAEEFFMIAPAAVGVESECEYVAIHTQLKSRLVKSKIQELFPNWLKIEKFYNYTEDCDLNDFSYREILSITFDRLADNIDKVKAELEGYKKQKLIYAYSVDENEIKVAQSSNLSNAMCDVIEEILAKINCPPDYKIVRKKLLIEDEDLVELGDYLAELEKEIDV